MIVHYVMGRRTQEHNRLGAKVVLEYNDADSVRTSNEGLVYKKFLEGLSGDFLTDEIKDEFEVTLRIENVKRNTQTVFVDYGRLTKDTIPMWEISKCMDVYRALKKEIRRLHDNYLAAEAEKEKRRVENGIDNLPKNNEN